MKIKQAKKFRTVHSRCVIASDVDILILKILKIYIVRPN